MRDNGELNKARVASLVQQHVVQLQVSIDDASIVQVEEADGDLGGVETAKEQEKETSKPALLILCRYPKGGRMIGSRMQQGAAQVK